MVSWNIFCIFMNESKPESVCVHVRFKLPSQFIFIIKRYTNRIWRNDRHFSLTYLWNKFVWSLDIDKLQGFERKRFIKNSIWKSFQWRKIIGKALNIDSEMLTRHISNISLLICRKRKWNKIKFQMSFKLFTKNKKSFLMNKRFNLKCW